VLIVKTKQAVLVAEYKAPTQAGEAMGDVGRVADYFTSLNY
jgi:profilin